MSDLAGKDLQLWMGYSDSLQETAALYVDGKLVELGHPTEIKDWILGQFGVDLVFSDSFMLGGDPEDGAEAAASLEEIERFEVGAE